MGLLDFTRIIEQRGLSPADCRILRHDRRGSAAWMAGQGPFDSFVSYQRRGALPYPACRFVLHFLSAEPLPGGEATALFVAAHEITDVFPYTEGRLPRLHHPGFGAEDDGVEADGLDLVRLENWSDLSERVVINWGPGTRSWIQRPDLQRKEVIELRRNAHEPVFPGFAAFRTTLQGLPTLPATWRGVLRSVRGVYLLVCPDSGDLYVGSAYGADGFWGRWEAYAANGHGGNAALRQRGPRDYAISILEVASPELSSGDIIRREQVWKEKLGSRAYGLNLN